MNTTYIKFISYFEDFLLDIQNNIISICGVSPRGRYIIPLALSFAIKTKRKTYNIKIERSKQHPFTDTIVIMIKTDDFTIGINLNLKKEEKSIIYIKEDNECDEITYVEDNILIIHYIYLFFKVFFKNELEDFKKDISESISSSCEDRM